MGGEYLVLSSVISHTKYLPFVCNLRYLFATTIVQCKLQSRRTLSLGLIFLALHFPGCLKTVVPIPEEDKNVPRLIKTAQAHAICHYSSNTQNSSLNTEGTRGHQYFMGVIPFGSIATSSGSELVAHYLRQEGGILGFSCVKESPDFSSPLLFLSVDEITLSGYDYIFFRKPSASLIVRADLYDHGSGGLTLKRSCKANSDEYELRQYAFGKELARVFEAAWRNVMSELLKCILQEE
jgi:hypothetical protein